MNQHKPGPGGLVCSTADGRMCAACSAGGTVKDGVPEEQGDQTGRALAWLLACGFAAKRAGA